MDFSPDINERIESLTRKCLDKQKVIKDFIGLMQARADLEEYYSRNLEKIADSLAKLIHGKDSLKDIFLILRNYFHVQTEQTRTMARQIKNDVISELDQFISNDLQWQKQIQMYRSKHAKEIRRNIDTLNQLRDDYITALNEEKRWQMNNSIQRKFNYRQCEVKLQNFIQYYNQYIETYFQDIAHVQDIFEGVELTRRSKVQDSAFKFLMFEISVIRNLQYDLTGISGKLEAYNPKNELSELFKEPPSDKPLLSKLNFENFKEFLQAQVYFKPEPIQTKKKKPIFEQTAPSKVDVISQTNHNQVFMKLIQSALFSNIISDENVNTLEGLLEQTSPNVFVESFERVLRMKMNQEEEEDQNGLFVSPEAYVSLLKLMVTLLDYANKKNQFGSAIVRALNQSKLIYKVIITPDQLKKSLKLTLFEGLNTHEVLQNFTLWSEFADQFQGKLSADNAVLLDNNVVKDHILQQVEDFLLQLELIGCKPELVIQLRQRLGGSGTLVSEQPIE